MSTQAMLQPPSVTGAQQHLRTAAVRRPLGQGQDVGLRRMVGQPGAAAVFRSPGRITRTVDGEFVPQVQVLAEQTADAIFTRRRQLAAHLVEIIIVYRVRDNQALVQAVPPNGMRSGLEGRLADQVADPPALAVFNDQRDKTGFLEFEGNANRRMGRRVRVVTKRSCTGQSPEHGGRQNRQERRVYFLHY